MTSDSVGGEGRGERRRNYFPNFSMASSASFSKSDN